MKKLIIALLLAFAISAVPAFAADTSTDHFDQAGIVYDHSHTVDTTTGFGAGIGADVVVYKGTTPYIEEVVIENRYDINNDEFRVYGVVRVDLFGALTGK